MRFAATRLLAGGAICTTSAAKRAAASADSASSDSSGKPAPPQSDCELDAAHLSHRRVFLLGDVTDDSANALIKRKPTATYSPEDFEEEHKQHLAARYADIGNEGKTIHKLLLESNKTLKVSKGPMMNAAPP